MPKIFGLEHIIYMVITFSLTIAGLILIKKFCKTEKSQKIAVKIAGTVLFVTILVNRLCVYLWQMAEGNTTYPYLPVSLCATVSMLFGFATIVCKKDSSVLHFLTYTAIFTGLISTIYPTYIGQGATIFFASTITSLLHHSLSFFVAILILELGWITPNIKKWYAWPLGYCGLITYGVFTLKMLGKSYDSMNINSPLLKGTFLNWFYLGLLFLALYTVFLLIFDTIKNKKQCFVVTVFNKIKNVFSKSGKKEKTEDKLPKNTTENIEQPNYVVEQANENENK